MFPDFKELLASFNAYGVKYLIVGGYAVSFHAQPRATKDLDLWIKADLVNANAAYAALASFGAPLDDFTVEDLADKRKFVRFGREPIAVDILSSIEGVDFDEAWLHRVEAVIAPDIGLHAFFLSRSDLIASKINSGRLRDLADVEEIRNVIQAQAAEPKSLRTNQ